MMFFKVCDIYKIDIQAFKSRVQIDFLVSTRVLLLFDHFLICIYAWSVDLFPFHPRLNHLKLCVILYSTINFLKILISRALDICTL